MKFTRSTKAIYSECSMQKLTKEITLRWLIDFAALPPDVRKGCAFP